VLSNTDEFVGCPNGENFPLKRIYQYIHFFEPCNCVTIIVHSCLSCNRGSRVTMDKLRQILRNVKSNYTNVDEDLILSAHAFMKKAHEGQKRFSGQPYHIHPLEVALILSEMNFDISTIVAGLLHDVIEDTSFTEEKINELYGVEICSLVKGVTKISKRSQTKGNLPGNNGNICSPCEPAWNSKV